MKKVNIFLPLLFLLSIFLVTSCSKDDTPGPYIPKSVIQFVNAYTNADAVMITNGYGEIVTPGYQPLFYRTSAVPTLFYPGNRIINVINLNDNKLASQTTVNLKDSTYYTSFVYGNSATANNLFVVNAPIKNFDATKAASRFFHLASNLGPVNVYLNDTNTPLFTNRAAETTSGLSEAANTAFTTQTSGTFEILVTDLNNNVLIKKQHNFEANNYYSITLVGDNNSQTKGLYLGIVNQ